MKDRKEETCAACGGEKVTLRMEVDRFEYGLGEDTATLQADVEVYSCAECGFEYTAEQASVARHAAVCRHLHVMTPEEIKALRIASGLSRKEFARFTQIGEASIGRWEAALNIQTRAYDNFLYLLGFEDNRQRLRRRQKAALQGAPSG